MPTCLSFLFPPLGSGVGEIKLERREERDIERDRAWGERN